MPRPDRSLLSAHPLPCEAPPHARKVCLHAQPAIFSCAKARLPFAPEPQLGRPQTRQRFRLPASPSVPRLHLQTAWPEPPAVHPSFPPTTHRKAPPPACSQKPATARSFPIAESNPPPSRSLSSAPNRQFRCLPEQRRSAQPPVSPFHTRDALASVRSLSN